MTRTIALTAAFVLAAPLTAAPPPVPVAKTPIAADNAQKVSKLKEFPIRASRIVVGPGRGELTLLDWKNSLTVVDDVDFKTLRTLAKDKKPGDFAFAPGGKLWVYAESGSPTYTALDTDTGKTFPIEVGDFAGYATFSPDGKRIAIGRFPWNLNPGGVKHPVVNIYDTGGKLLQTLDEKSGNGLVTPLYSPDGKYLAVGNRNYEPRIFDAATGKLLHTFSKTMTHGIAFRHDSKRLALSYVDGHIGILDVETGKVIHSVPSGCEEVYSVDWGKNGDVLASAGLNGKLTLWNAETMKPIKEFEIAMWMIQVRFSADGSRLFTASSGDHSAQSERKITVFGLE